MKIEIIHLLISVAILFLTILGLLLEKRRRIIADARKYIKERKSTDNLFSGGFIAQIDYINKREIFSALKKLVDFYSTPGTSSEKALAGRILRQVVRFFPELRRIVYMNNTKKETMEEKCPYCREPIEEQAKFCKSCRMAVRYGKFRNLLINWSRILAILISAITLFVVALGTFYNIAKIKREYQQLTKSMTPHLEIEALGLYTDPQGRGEDPSQLWSGVIFEVSNLAHFDVKNVEIEKCDIKLPRGLIKKDDMWGGTPILTIPKADPPNISKFSLIAPFTEAKTIIEDYKNGKQSFSVDIILAYYYTSDGKKSVYRYGYKGKYESNKFIQIEKGEIKN